MWLTALQKTLGGEVSDDKMRDYIWNTLKAGRVRRNTHTHTHSPEGRCQEGPSSNAQSALLTGGRLSLVTDTPSSGRLTRVTPASGSLP